jgi:hypothetical protein
VLRICHTVCPELSETNNTISGGGEGDLNLTAFKFLPQPPPQPPPPSASSPLFLVSTFVSGGEPDDADADSDAERCADRLGFYPFGTEREWTDERFRNFRDTGDRQCTSLFTQEIRLDQYHYYLLLIVGPK